MVLVRHLLGGVLRRQRLRQGLTLREVSLDARVSLGYISEVERGQKEASSELLAAICSALEVPLSDVLREVSDEIDKLEGVIAPPVRQPRLTKVHSHRIDRAGVDSRHIGTRRIDRSRIESMQLGKARLDTARTARLETTHLDASHLDTGHLEPALVESVRVGSPASDDNLVESGLGDSAPAGAESNRREVVVAA